jgi:RNA polymerase sigma factor (sigma-70 family)
VGEHLVRVFPRTRHSAVEAVRSGTPAQRARALQTLSSVYWAPVYTHLRLRWAKPHEEAADLAQEFFAEVVEKELIARFDPSRSRLRTWLRVCLDGLVANHRRAAARHKRTAYAPADVDPDGLREQVEKLAAPDTPETLFEKEWTRGVFALSLRRLRDDYARVGREDSYALLEQYDLAAHRQTYAELAERAGLTVTDVTNRLFRARRDLRRTVLQVLRELTASDDEFREEARALLGATPP